VKSLRRYLELRRAGELPVCQTNGCHRYAKVLPKEYRGGIDIPGMPGMKLQRAEGKSLKQAKIRYTLADRSTRKPIVTPSEPLPLSAPFPQGTVSEDGTYSTTG
jgi:hypothetical protein